MGYKTSIEGVLSGHGAGGGTHYKLAPDRRTAVPCSDLDEFDKFMQSDDRVLALDYVWPDDPAATAAAESVARLGGLGMVRVSTVFLGIDHNWGRGPPVLWETMIFGGPHDEFQERYSSHESAVAGHARAVRIARGEIEPDHVG